MKLKFERIFLINKLQLFFGPNINSISYYHIINYYSTYNIIFHRKIVLINRNDVCYDEIRLAKCKKNRKNYIKYIMRSVMFAMYRRLIDLSMNVSRRQLV